MLRLIIAEDEKPAREKLKRLLAELSDYHLEVIAEAHDGIEAVEKIDTLKPDFLILDVQMPGLNGFEVLETVRFLPHVIFATAYDEYAIKAFELNAVDYLLKPYNAERLKAAIDRIGSRHPRPDEKLEKRIRGVVSDMLSNANRPVFLQRVPVRIGERIRLIQTNEIFWFDSKNSITFAHTENKSHDIHFTLEELELRLDPAGFFRSHRSSIVNLNAIGEMIPWFNGKFKLILKDTKKTELMVSRTRARDLKSVLGW